MESQSPNGGNKDVCMGREHLGEYSASVHHQEHSEKGEELVRFRRMDQINEPVKDNGNRYLMVWEESYQKEEKYWIDSGSIRMNPWL